MLMHFHSERRHQLQQLSQKQQNDDDGDGDGVGIGLDPVQRQMPVPLKGFKVIVTGTTVTVIQIVKFYDKSCN